MGFGKIINLYVIPTERSDEESPPQATAEGISPRRLVEMTLAHYFLKIYHRPAKPVPYSFFKLGMTRRDEPLSHATATLLMAAPAIVPLPLVTTQVCALGCVCTVTP